jgi:hypothetical protein
LPHAQEATAALQRDMGKARVSSIHRSQLPHRRHDGAAHQRRKPRRSASDGTLEIGGVQSLLAALRHARAAARRIHRCVKFYSNVQKSFLSLSASLCGWSTRAAGTRFQLSFGLSPAARASPEPAEAAEKPLRLAHPQTTRTDLRADKWQRRSHSPSQDLVSKK